MMLINLSWLHLLLLNLVIMLASGKVESYSRNDFPPAPHFVFGSGTSAYQVEGAAFEDGRTPSIWDTFVHTGHSQGADGDIACDAYHKYKEDARLMAETGLEAYRFSISWSRLIPNGRGPVNPKGLQYYNNLINELIGHGIQPHVTLVHIDLPQALHEDYGGWLSLKIVKDFTAYADVCFKEFGDRVMHWITINEPNVYAWGGYDLGFIPPARCSESFMINCTKGKSFSEPYIAAHNMLLSHAAAARLYKKKYKATQHGFVGFNIYASWLVPYSNSSEDAIATQRAKDFFVGWLVNPLVFGDYPDVIKKNAGTKLPVLTELEKKKVKGSFDFLGVNHYNVFYVKDSPSNIEIDSRDTTADMEIQQILKQSDAPPDQNSIEPEGLISLLEYVKHTYGNPPIYVHENGQRIRRNGTLNDTPRVEYLQAYIGGLLDALRNGSNAKGYFQWSFLDCLELLDGYSTGYGLYYVDLDDNDLKRYPKLSAHWYSNFFRGQSVNPVEVIETRKNLTATSQSQFSH